MKKLYRSALTLLLAVGLAACGGASRSIDLVGSWTVSLDSLDQGIARKWYEQNGFNNSITLPGTLCDGGYGTPCALQPAMEREIFLDLKRKYDYVGPAWYSRTVDVPADWTGRRVVLTLERVLWHSQVWVNGQKVEDENESLTTPHRFDLTDCIKPGQANTLTLRIDNRKRHEISSGNLGHSYTNATQTLWNGVLGRMTLEAEDALSIADVRLLPDIENQKVQVRVRFEGQATADARLDFGVTDPSGKALPVQTRKVDGNELSFDYPLPDPVLWDEFNPALYKATAILTGDNLADEAIETFGMRRLTNDDAQLQVNGRRIFLRGTLECCIFPLKGYPPTDEAEWEKVFNAARNYGLNHIRFHSWCPPEAAFNVADRMGLYVQVELPVWSVTLGDDPSVFSFLYDEGRRIMSEYGNHPSFCFWSMGNELQRDFQALDSLMMTLKREDPRHLYTTTSFTFEHGHGSWPEPNDDFWVTQWTKKGWVRGQGVFDDQPVNFDRDYSASIDSLPVPIVTHEIGQYSVYPNLKEISKYTGNLMPLNFQAVKNDLKQKGHEEWAEENLMASGKLAAILYKEEIERALKTPGFSGFQLLDLHDFPGQGTALVGLLDAFWDSKGLIAPEEFRTFCSPVVPLARFAKATYTNDETLTAQFEVANFGAGPLKNAILKWNLTGTDGTVMAQGNLPAQDFAVGNALKAGDIAVPLNKVTKADKLTLSLDIEGTDYHNSWHLWVYPRQLEMPQGDVLYTRSFAEAGKVLAQGRSVLLNPTPDDLNGLEGKFVQVFWSPVHFPNQAGTMGIWCDPQHPALADFPTDAHSNWQWWDLCKHAKTLVLDSLSAPVKPIVRMTDNFYKNRNLGLVFEAKVGTGKLLFCASDLTQGIVAGQMRYSLLRYMASPAFAPAVSLPFDEIKSVFHNVDRTRLQKKSIYE